MNGKNEQQNKTGEVDRNVNPSSIKISRKL